jgi:hypothetical protein
VSNQIFIRSRRNDSQLVCDRMYDSLSEAYGAGQVYRELDMIATGIDYRAAVDQALQSMRCIVASSACDAGATAAHRRLLGEL